MGPQERTVIVQKPRNAEAYQMTPVACFLAFLTSALLKRGQRKLWRDLFSLGPVVIGMALEAAALGVVRPGSMARLAGGHPRE